MCRLTEKSKLFARTGRKDMGPSGIASLPDEAAHRHGSFSDRHYRLHHENGFAPSEYIREPSPDRNSAFIDQRGNDIEKKGAV